MNQKPSNQSLPVWSSVSDIWDSRSSGLQSSCRSRALPSTAHIACLTVSGRLHSTAAALLSGPLVVLVSPKCWCFHCTWEASPGLSSGFLDRHVVPSLSFSLWPLQSWGFYCTGGFFPQWPLLASHSAKPQLPSTSFQTQVPTGRLLHS